LSGVLATMVLMPAVVAAIAVEGAGASSPNGGLTE
jgi:hypothetical protein